MQKRTKKGSQSLGPALRNCPALLETTGSLKTREVYTPLRGAQTGRSLRLPKLLFRSFLSANIILPTIDSGARRREMARIENYSYWVLQVNHQRNRDSLFII